MEKFKINLKDNPKLEQRLLADGRISLFLVYYFGRQSEAITDEFGNPVLYESGKMIGTPKYKVKHLRRKEALNLYLISKPRTIEEREQNKEILLTAKKIRAQKEQELYNNDERFWQRKKIGLNLFEFFDDFVQTANVADRRVLEGALRNFKTFMKEQYPLFTNKLKANNLSKEMMQKFADYIGEHHKGEGVDTYFTRFKRIINYAVEKGVISKSPCLGVTIPKRDDILAKDILSQEEMLKLFATHYEGENPEIRRAFAMTCLTGIRRCDIVELTYDNVDYSNRILKFRQSKTQKHSKSSGVTIPLNDTLMSIIGKKEEYASDGYIFHLPSDTMCLKALRRWTKKACIDKHITWHCGRHSFATSLLNNGVNIKVVSSLLGHSTLRFTEIYLRAVDKQKVEAINTLPNLNIE